MTITQRTYGHGSITLTAYESSRRIRVEAIAENSVMDWHELFEFVDAIRKPQQVTTLEELDALPAATVVKDALTQVFEKQEAGIWHDGPHDWLAFDGKFWDVDAIHLPATVLHVGGAE